MSPAPAGAQVQLRQTGPRPAPGRGWLVCGALVLLAYSAGAPRAQPAIPEPPPNLIEISTTVTTAGQPSAAWLRTLKQQGYDAVIYLAPSTVIDAIKEEPQIVRRQGLAYVNIPIVFSNPTEADFEAYARALRAFEGKRILVHCQVNMRASVMTFLYRTIHLGQEPSAAYDAVTRVWTPGGPWKRLIQDQLRKHAIAFDPF